MTPLDPSRPALRKLAKNRRFEELEAALPEEIAAGELPLEELLSVLTLVTHRADEKLVETFLVLGITSWAGSHGPEGGLEVARGISPLRPQSDLLRDEVMGLYLETAEEYPNLDGLLERTVLDTALPLPEGMARVDAILTLPPETLFREKRGKTAGRITGFTPEGDALLGQLDGVERRFTLEEAKTLEPLPSDDYRCLAVYAPETLVEWAESDPGKLVESLLQAHGPKLTYREVRALLSEVVGNFPNWWNQVAPAVRREAWVAVGSGTQPPFELRKKALSHEVRVRWELADAEDAADSCRVILDYIEQSGEHLAEELELVAHLAGALDEIASTGKPHESLAAGALLARLAEAAPDAKIPDAPEPGENVDPSLLPDPRLQRIALDHLRARAEDWPERFATILASLAPDLVDEAAATLREAGREDLLFVAAETVLSAPSRFTGGLIWLWREVGAGRLPESEGGPHRPRLLSDFIVAVDRAHALGAAGFTKIRGVLSARSFETARSVLENADRDEAAHVKEALGRCFRMSDDFRAHLSDVLAETHPALYVRHIPPWELDDVLFSTAAGLERKRGDYHHLVNTVLPEIAEAIGKAAAEGDLSENAEYTGNIERRDRMTERANSLQRDLAMARVMQPEMAGDREVSVGSRVLARDLDSGEELSLTFLGPWDVDVEQGIYSYRAPLSLSFMGKKPGETVDFTGTIPPRRFEILSIESGIPS